MRVTALVLAAGRGERFSSRTSKLLVPLGGKPLILYSLAAFNRHPSIDDIIFVTNRRNKQAYERLINKYRIKKVKTVVLGGRRRQDSVRKALEKVNRSTHLVLIHDGARPFVDAPLVGALIRAAKRTGAAVAGVPVKATIKEARSQGRTVTRSMVVAKTLDRDRLWEIQTPQVFRKDVIVKAYARFAKLDVTDDASLVEKLKLPVAIVRGSYANIKITTAEDLRMAQALRASGAAQRM